MAPRPEHALDRGRVAVVAALLVTAVWGLRARAAAGRLAVGGPLIRQGVVLVASLLALAFLAGVALLAASTRLVRRVPEDRRYVEMIPYTRWSRALALLAGVTVALAPLAAVVVLAGRLPEATSTPITPSARPPPRDAPTGAHVHRLTALPAVTVAVGAIALLILLVVLVGTARRPGHTPGRVGMPAPTDGDENRAAAQLTVEAGRAALAGPLDPRAGVVACYAALERAMAASGAPPQGSDTPAEVLARLAGAGTAARRAASALTTLFREARYSPHPVAEADRRAADALLAELEIALKGHR
jgi:hypothetical protein